MRGLVSVDWMVGIAIFLVFTSFAIVYTTRSVPPLDQPLGNGAGLITDSIMDNLTIDHQNVPITYDSIDPQPGAVMYLKFVWPYGMNSTQILQGSTPLPCLLEDSTLYWQADLVPGENNFTMSFRDEDTPLNCSGAFSTVNANQTIPGLGEPSKLISQTRLDQMNSVNYSDFKSSLGIPNEFRVVMNISGTETTFGPETPLTSNVFGRTRWGRVMETGETGTIRVLVW